MKEDTCGQRGWRMGFVRVSCALALEDGDDDSERDSLGGCLYALISGWPS